jgi:GAF domain-containing protein
MWRFILRENIRDCRLRIAREASPDMRAVLAQRLGTLEAELEDLVALSTPDLVRRVPALGVIADRAIRDAMRLAGAQFAHLQIFDWNSDDLVILAQRNFRAPFLQHFAAIRDDGDRLCGRALAEGGPLTVADVATDPHFAAHRDVALAEGVRALQITPLRTARGDCLGVLSIHFGNPRAFVRNDLDRMIDHATAVADRLQPFLQNACG